MQRGRPSTSGWNEVVGWVAFWILADAALAAVPLKADLVTSNRCLGRVDEVHAPYAAPLAISPVAEEMWKCSQEE